MINLFSSFDNIDEDHPVAGLISSMSVIIQGPVRPGTVCPYVIINKITVDNGSVTYNISVCADMIGTFSSPVVVDIRHNGHDDIQYSDNGLSIHIRTSGIEVPAGTYDINARLRLCFINIIPERSTTVNGNTVKGGIAISSGYNVSVTLAGDDLSIYGGPGVGTGKYFKGGTDNLYNGIRNVNGVNLSNNLDISMSDILVENGGRVQ